MFFMNRGSVRSCGSAYSTSSAGGLDVSGCCFLSLLFSVHEQHDGSDVTAARSQFYICVSSHYTVWICASAV